MASITFSLFSLTGGEFRGDVFVMRGKIFESGEWPDRDFALSPQELAAAAQAFKPVPIDVEHIDSIFDGKLGHLTEVEARDDNNTLFGTLTMPRWMENVIDTSTKVSCTWDTATKRLLSLALVQRPGIEDAEVFEAAFTAIETQQGGIMPFVDDLAQRLAQIWGHTPPVTPVAPTEPQQTEPSDPPKDGGAGDAGTTQVHYHINNTPFAPTEPATQEPQAGQQPEADPNVTQLQAVVQQQQQQIQAIQEQYLAAQAAQFANSVILDRRAQPAEFQSIVTDYMQSARDDMQHPTQVSFTADGKSQQGSRVDLCKARYAARPQHNLTFDQLNIPESVQVLFNNGSEPKEEKDKYTNDELLGMTTYGRGMLASRQNGNGTKS